jgi:hypothetical protein
MNKKELEQKLAIINSLYGELVDAANNNEMDEEAMDLFEGWVVGV